MTTRQLDKMVRTRTNCATCGKRIAANRVNGQKVWPLGVTLKRGGTRHRMFCSAACRAEWQDEYRSALKAGGQQAAWRTCLGCDREFRSEGPGNRRCPTCHERDGYREGVPPASARVILPGSRANDALLRAHDAMAFILNSWGGGNC